MRPKSRVRTAGGAVGPLTFATTVPRALTMRMGSSRSSGRSAIRPPPTATGWIESSALRIWRCLRPLTVISAGRVISSRSNGGVGYCSKQLSISANVSQSVKLL